MGVSGQKETRKRTCIYSRTAGESVCQQPALAGVPVGEGLENNSASTINRSDNTKVFIILLLLFFFSNGEPVSTKSEMRRSRQ